MTTTGPSIPATAVGFFGTESFSFSGLRRALPSHVRVDRVPVAIPELIATVAAPGVDAAVAAGHVGGVHPGLEALARCISPYRQTIRGAVCLRRPPMG